MVEFFSEDRHALVSVVNSLWLIFFDASDLVHINPPLASGSARSPLSYLLHLIVKGGECDYERDCEMSEHHNRFTGY